MIENVLYNHLLNYEQLSAALTGYGEHSAVFQQFSPVDTDSGWDNENHYPQIVYNIDTTGDSARKAAGILSIDIICNGTESTSLEALTLILKQAVNGYFFTNNEGDTYAAAWERTDGFTTEPGNKMYGNTVTFSLLAFPQQTTVSLDPVALLNAWIKSKYDNVTVIGSDILQDVFKPSNNNPAVYWELIRQTQSQFYTSTYFVEWMDATLQLHVMADAKHVQDTLIRQATHSLSALKRIIFSNGSPFQLDQITDNFSADPIRTGQMTLIGTYGIVRDEPDVPKLNNPHFDVN